MRSSHGRGSTIHRAVALLTAVALTGLPGSVRAVAFSVTPAENDQLNIAISTLIGGLDAGVVLGFVPIYPISLIGELAEIGTNHALKLTPPIFDPPADQTVPPNAGCFREFTLPQVEDQYEEWFGFWEIDALETNWGNLGRPTVRHANTAVDVRVDGPFLEPGLVRLPEGRWEFDWVAGSQYSPVFDSVVPAILLVGGVLVELKYASAVGAKAAQASTKQAARARRAARKVLADVFVSSGERATSFGLEDVFGTITAAENRATQVFTVLDTHTPIVRGPAGAGPAIEAADLGGVRFVRAEQELLGRFEHFDVCSRVVRLRHDAPHVLPVGTTVVRWTGSDGGNYPANVPATATYFQTVVVQDTQPPLLLPPDAQVHELPVGVDLLSLDTIDLGLPQVVDLSDPEPDVVHEGPAVLRVGTRQPIRWMATDAQGNDTTRIQWLSAKREGENTAPTALPTQGATRTSVPIDLRLEGIDLDFLATTLPGEPGEPAVTVDMVDALGFEIVDRPGHGEFIAPLRPVFIEDFRLTPVGETESGGVRTSPLGTLAAEFQALPPSQRDAWVSDVGCPAFGGDFPVDMVYEPTYVHVTDEGLYYVRDSFFVCTPSGSGYEAAQVERISRWSEQREFLGHARLNDSYGGGLGVGPHRDIFSVDRNGDVWWISEEPANSGSAFQVHHVSADLSRFFSRRQFGLTLQEVTGQRKLLQHAHADGDLLYVHDRRGVLVYRDAELLGRLTVDGEELFIPAYGASFPFPETPCESQPAPGAIRDFLATDSTGALYVSEACGNRIHKFAPTEVAPNGEFELGGYIGWMGRCSANVPPFSGCDEDLGVSKGFGCTDATCLREDGSAGNAPGQFDAPGHINIDPNDQLYVADSGNLRVQRFGVDGTFAGEARSEGTGVNQGDRPGFVLGNFGPPAAVSVNSTSFFVLESSPVFGDFFLHVFEGLPFRPIPVAEGDPADVDLDGFEDNAVTVRYVPRFDFPSALGQTRAVDTFRYRVSDGLAASAPATVAVTVDRSFRPPEKLTIACYDPADGRRVDCVVDEDEVIEVELEARDPDGVIGFGGLDVLSYSLTGEPQDGVLDFVSANAGLARYRFSPDPDYNGLQTLRYRVSDGVDSVDSGSLAITVLPVDDDPVFSLTHASASRGFASQIRIEVYDVDADPLEGLPDHISFEWGDDVFETPGELIQQPDGSFEMTGPLAMQVDAGRYTIHGAPIFPEAGPAALRLRWSYEPDGVHDGAERLVPLGSVDVIETSQVSVALEPAVYDPAASTFVTIEVVVQNALPEGWSGYAAQDVTLELEFAPDLQPPAVGGPCQSVSGRILCSLGDLAPGDQVRMPFPTFVAPEGFEPSPKVRAVVRGNDPGGAVERQVEAMLFPRWTDDDGDTLPDEWERAYGLAIGMDDSGVDSDGDGLDNADEYAAGTIPVEPDSDGDGADDFLEYEVARTDPTVADTDGDLLLDGWEILYGFDPNLPDTGEDPDGDGVSNVVEQRNGTDPRLSDSDGDGVDDGLALLDEGFVALVGGATSVRFDPAALAQTGLTVESTSVEVETPGALGPDSIAFPINDRTGGTLGSATSFLFSPDDFFGTFGGVVGHLGIVHTRDLSWNDVSLGDFVLRYDPSRGGNGGRSGFFLESTTGTAGISFDLASSGTATATRGGLELEANLLLAPELASAIGQLPTAGTHLGEVFVRAVPEPGAALLGLVALSVLVAIRSRRRPGANSPGPASNRGPASATHDCAIMQAPRWIEGKTSWRAQETTSRCSHPVSSRYSS